MLKKILRLFFGDDVFISYARSDGKHYATTLKNQLASMDISCFIDYEKVYAGDVLNTTLKRAIRKSTVFVLVGTPNARNSDFVQLEINEARRIKSPIIPIDVNEAVSNPPWDCIGGDNIVWMPESSAPLNEGKPDEAVPSPHIYEEIRKLFSRNRRNVRVRAIITASILVLLSASVIAVWQSMVAQARSRELVESNGKLEKTNSALVKNQNTFAGDHR